MNTKESLQDKAIVISGVFEKYSRKELKAIIENGGGKNASSISKNTSFILAGDKMGPNKKLKAEELNIEMIGEEEFIKKYI
ncbi:MAG: BRCT domain-containing protein [Cytophagales bacterium]